jgi:two-component system sensor histidine kinase YesM
MINVIIADDEKNVVKLIQTLVDWERLGMRIAGVAHNGLDALKLVRAARADLLVTDIRMPGMDGMKLVELAKAERPKLEIIIISGYRSSALAVRAAQFHVVDFIYKPIKRERLHEALEKARGVLASESDLPSASNAEDKSYADVIAPNEETGAAEPQRENIPRDSDVGAEPAKHGYLMNRAFIIIALLAVLCAVMAGVLLFVNASRMFRLIAGPVGLAAFGALMGFGVRGLYLRHKECERMLSLYQGGYITLKDVSRLAYLPSRGIDGALGRLLELRGEQELIASSRRQAQYLAMQNQINPHFLYNTLEGIRGEALSEGLLTVAGMAETLAALFRYTISNVDNLVTLKNELDNVQDYFRIQQFRFGERIKMRIHCDEQDEEQIFKCKMPKIILQPIVENAVIHGLEGRTEQGCVDIRIVASQKRLMITVSDDGVGIPEELLEGINRKLGVTSLDYQDTYTAGAGSGIAMINVNNRIRLMFGDEYGVTIYSTLNEGTDVLITLPLIEAVDSEAADRKETDGEA